MIFQQAIESETSKGSEVLKEKLDIFKDKAKKVNFNNFIYFLGIFIYSNNNSYIYIL